MSINKVTEEGTAMTAGISVQSGQTASRFFRVTFDGADSVLNEPLLARFATDGSTAIPFLNSCHPDNFWLIAENIQSRYIGPHNYQVEVIYASPRPSEQNDSNLQDPNLNPLEQPPEVEWDFDESIEPISEDIYGNPINNSAGEGFDPPITREFSDLVLRIRKNQADFNYLMAADYKNKVNSDWFFGFAPTYAKCRVIKAVRRRFGNMFYFECIYEFAFRTAKYGGIQPGWIKRILDAGFRELIWDDTNKKYKLQNITLDGEQPAKAVKLNGVGLQLPINPSEFYVEECVFLPYEIYEYRNFAYLGL
jgi:hypothetical protein